jgi:site-specific recombinase XerC
VSPNLTRQLLEALVNVGRIASAMLGSSAAPELPASSDFSLTLAETVNEFLRAKARAGRSDRYLRELRMTLKSFSRGRFSTPLCDVTAADIEAWLGAHNWAMRTQRGYLTDLRTLFNFAVRRGMLQQNPANVIELPDAEQVPQSLHTPEQAAVVLEFARSYDPDVCRSLAVRYFAGLRSAEIERITEAEIKAEFIEVPASKSKTRRRRLVMIQPNLKAWLALGGELPLRNVSNKMRWFTGLLQKTHGIEWTHNVTRHSWCSYHLAQFQNAGKTALEAGHSEQMLFNHYRELVTPDQAKEFWKIVPK